MMLFGLTDRIVIVDAETCSAVDLKKSGSYRYFADRSTRTLMVGFQDYTSEEVDVWQPHQGPVPRSLADAIAAPPEQCLLAGFNMAFDAQALQCLGFSVPIEKQLDIALLSYMLGFSGGLDNVLEQFDIPHRKSPEGRRLIQRFSRSMKPWYQYPTDWDKFLRYCAQDVAVETLLLRKCARWLDAPLFRPMTRHVQAQWRMDQRMNQRGLPVSLPTVEGALAILEVESRRLRQWMSEATGLDNPNSVPQLTAWLETQGHRVPDLQAGTVISLMEELPKDSLTYQVLEARQSLGRASVKKFASMHASHVDGRLKGSVTTYGASRTGRTASRGVNLANLERPKLRFTDLAANVIESGSHAAFETYLQLFEPGVSVIQGLGSCVRGAIKAPPDAGITAVDLKSIESVGLAWMAGCQTILDLFHRGRDTYKDFATRYYEIPYEAVTKQQRSFCKPAVLGCFAADTLVLTDQGWVPITHVSTTDKLWDGAEWVSHGGVIYQGIKTVLSRAGVRATPEHPVLQGSDWTPWAHWTDGPAAGQNESVYDILNAGPRHRFTIFTERGSQIVHNCGYGAGPDALVKYAYGMGVVMDTEVAERMVQVFRTEFLEIPAYWKAVDRAAKQAVTSPGTYVQAPKVTFYFDGAFLYCTLPSKRTLFYYKPQITLERRQARIAGEPDWFSESLSYMGKKQDSGGAWHRVYTHGGKLVENIVQAICRDILYHGLSLIDKDPDVSLIGSLYDEVITLTNSDPDTYKRITAYMETKPAWLDEQFFLGSDGYFNAKRYRK